MKNNSPCEGCAGGLRCYNSSSPCYLYYCGEWPGTGPEAASDAEEDGREENG